jgi:hypothetical protein
MSQIVSNLEIFDPVPGYDSPRDQRRERLKEAIERVAMDRMNELTRALSVDVQQLCKALGYPLREARITIAPRAVEVWFAFRDDPIQVEEEE